MDLQAHLASCDSRYSREHCMLGYRQKSAGYHTTVPDGRWVHGTRGSLDYALALLASGRPEHVRRAADVIRAVLALQDTRPASRTYGIWPYLLEEPLAEMSPPDWNWADFCGASLVMMLGEHAARLPAALSGEIRTALGHAARSIVRRDVGAAYTNIAIMGAGVTLAAGELLADASLLDYGRRRLEAIVRHTRHHGGFTEYNSPCYTMVALHECERILQVVADASARRSAEALRRTAWATVAEHFHPGTGQWAGPHSRAYADLLPERTARYLAAQTHVRIGPAGPEDARGGYSAVRPLPCPDEWVGRFGELGADSVAIRRCFFRAEDDRRSLWGTTWLTPDACLGSINCDSLWTQRRCLIGYWRVRGAGAAVLRVRFLHDGRDFASAAFRSVQHNGRALLAIGLFTDLGDWHTRLDRPSDGRFEAEDFRVRCELTAPGARARALGGGRYELAAGTRRAVLHTLSGRFDRREVRWQLTADADSAQLDGVCYAGRRRAFHLPSVGEACVPAALEVLGEGEPPSDAAPSVRTLDGRRVRVEWPLPDPLALTAPTPPQPYR